MGDSESEPARNVPSTQHALDRQRLTETRRTPWQQTRDACNRTADTLRLAQLRRAHRSVGLLRPLDGAKQPASASAWPQSKVERRATEFERRFQHANGAHL